MYILNIIVFSFTFFISIVICAQSEELDRSMFKISSMVSLEIAKEEIKQVYLDSGQTKTLHCGCFFDKQKQVYPNSCNITPPKEADLEELLSFPINKSKEGIKLCISDSIDLNFGEMEPQQFAPLNIEPSDLVQIN